jgi:hypothetical protein
MTEQDNQDIFILKKKNIFIWSVLLIGWLFDFLFWVKEPGISIPIFLLILAVGGFWLASQQELTPARTIYWLLIPAGFFGIMSVVRFEPMTTFLNIAGAFALLAILGHSFLGGKWWQYAFRDYLGGAFSLGLDTFIRPIAVFTSQPKPEAETENEQGQADKKQGIRTSLSILRGVLIAFPIVLVFAGILAEADPIFDQAIGDFLEIFKIDNLGEYIFRAILISIIAYIVLGVYLHAFYKNHDQGISGEKTHWLKPFLGITEATIVLGSINLLFLAFVIVQFQYFFGGQGNINLAGFTYAEYARRGFGELITVAVFSLLLFMGLSFVTRKEDQREHRIFSILGIVLFALVTVILVSSFQRLLLYEQVYGFTRLRIYTHVFIIWLGGLLLVVSLLQAFRKQGYFALAVLIAGLGFITTLNIANVDALIVRQNISRYQDGEPLDIGYLASLSEDIIPTLYNFYNEAESRDEKSALTAAIACHAEMNDHYDYANSTRRNTSWQSFHFSLYRAHQEWQDLLGSADAGQFEVNNFGNTENPRDSYVIVDGEEIPCRDSMRWDIPQPD